MAMRWYVIHAYSGFEGQVKRSLEERIKRAGMEELFGSVLVPTEEVVEMKAGQQRKSERKFFPGYVLVKMDMTDETWHLVKSVPKVMGFIGGTGDKPAPIPDKQVDAILQRVEEGVEKPRPKVLYEPGEVVRVTEGPFTDFTGGAEEVDDGSRSQACSFGTLGRLPGEVLSIREGSEGISEGALYVLERNLHSARMACAEQGSQVIAPGVCTHRRREWQRRFRLS